MSRIPIRDLNDYDFEEDVYEDKPRKHRPNNHTKKVEKKKDWDREVIYDPYGEDERR